MTIKMMAQSDVGVMRSINEDFYGVFEENKLAIVCDGMGGHKAGEQASRLAVSTIRYMFLFLDFSLHQKISKDLSDKNLLIATRLISSVRLANRNIYLKSINNRDFRGMGTTLSALSVQDDRIIIAHVGDSRIYRFRHGNMDQITEDHTWINELIQDQEIDPEDAKNFERQNVITRALGQAPAIKIDLHIESFLPGDLYLICTDGLTKAMPDDEIRSIVNYTKNDLNSILTHLIDDANIKDGSDNVTAALIKIDDSVKPKNSFLPLKMTLKPESGAISRFEDKILKREMSNSQTHASHPSTILSRAISSRLIHYGAVVVVLLVALIMIFSKFNNSSSEDESVGINKNVHAISKSNNVDKHSEKPSTFTADTETDSVERIAIPDSVINQLVSTSIQSANAGNRKNQKSLDSFQHKIKNRGIIYFAGFEKSKNIETSSLFVNYKYWGKTIDFRRSGLQLPPGKYSITIRDSMNNLIFKQNTVELSSGDVKTIQFSK